MDFVRSQPVVPTSSTDWNRLKAMAYAEKLKKSEICQRRKYRTTELGNIFCPKPSIIEYFPNPTTTWRTGSCDFDRKISTEKSSYLTWFSRRIISRVGRENRIRHLWLPHYCSFAVYRIQLRAIRSKKMRMRLQNFWKLGGVWLFHCYYFFRVTTDLKKDLSDSGKCTKKTFFCALPIAGIFRVFVC